VGQPVEEGSCEALVPEDLCPPLKFQVSGDDHGPRQVAAGAELKEGLASRRAE